MDVRKFMDLISGIDPRFVLPIVPVVVLILFPVFGM